jgi:DNA topoisomerase-1
MTVVDRLREKGIRRLGSPSSGFRYRTSSGKPATARDLDRIRSLVIPPGWTDVYVSPSPRALVQAIGRDRAGRWQYRYSARQQRIREERKRERLRALLRALPSLRTRVSRDLHRPDLDRERVLAGVVRILLRAFMRPGSQVYARDNGTYGIATLRRQHVELSNGCLTFRYSGKGGKPQVRHIEDPDVARLVRSLLRGPGRELFRYRGANGEWYDVRRRHINDYLKEITGEVFTAKDFRTWAGTLLGACALARQGYPSNGSARALRSRIHAAMKETAGVLGNTPTVCRTSYVCPDVLEAFKRRKLIDDPLTAEQLTTASSGQLSKAERRLASLLRARTGASAGRSRTAR